MNLYAYVGGDPVNAVDPWGLQALPNCRAGDYVNACWVYVYGRSGPRTGGVINAQEGAGGTFYDRWSQRWRPGTGTSGYCEVCMTDEYRVQQAQEAEFDRRYGGYAIAAVAAPVAAPLAAEAGGAFLATNAVRGLSSQVGRLSLNGIINLEGHSARFEAHGYGRWGQVRFFTDRLIIRLDIRQPVTHLNIQGRGFNYHIPPEEHMAAELTFKQALSRVARIVHEERRNHIDWDEIARLAERLLDDLNLAEFSIDSEIIKFLEDWDIRRSDRRYAEFQIKKIWPLILHKFHE